MTYVEWLRVRNVLRVLAVLLLVLIAISLVMRISFNKYLANDDEIIKHMQTQPGTTVAHSILSDGTKRTTINDPSEDTVVTIDDVGGGGRHIVVNAPRRSSHVDFNRAKIGSVDVNTEVRGDRSISTIDTNSSAPFIYYMMFADVVAFFVTTFLAAPFARENDGHLEYAVTKPASRVSLGLQIMGVDFVGILGSSVMTILALIICQAMFEVPRFDFSGISAQAIGMGIAFPLAWYAMLAAITASLKRGYGAILGFAWPASLVIIALTLIPLGDSLLGQTVHAISWTISRLIPLAYVDSHITINAASGQPQTTSGNFGIRLLILSALFIIYSAAALFQWKRVEA